MRLSNEITTLTAWKLSKLENKKEIRNEWRTWPEHFISLLFLSAAFFRGDNCGFFFLEVSNDVHGLCFFWHHPFHETMECSSGVTIHELSFYNNLSYYWLSERKGNKTASSVAVSFRRINLIRSPVWFPLPSGVFPATYWPHLSPWCQSLSFVGLFLCISMLSPRTCVYVCVWETIFFSGPDYNETSDHLWLFLTTPLRSQLPVSIVRKRECKIKRERLPK